MSRDGINSVNGMDLFAFPREIRDRIYSFIDLNVEVHVCHFNTKTAAWRSHVNRQHPPGQLLSPVNQTGRVSIVPPILFVNKQTNQEVLPFVQQRRVCLNFCQARDMTRWVDHYASIKQEQFLTKVSICTEVRMRWFPFVERLSQHVTKAVMEEIYLTFIGRGRQIGIAINVMPLAYELDEKKQRLISHFAVEPENHHIKNMDEWKFPTSSDRHH